MASRTDRPQAILYAAKSTEDVHGSIETQLAGCREDAEQEGFPVAAEYRDEAVSAFKGNRGPGLAAALKHVQRIGGVLIVQHSDRLARGDGRNARHLIEICLQAIKGDFKLRSVQDPSTFDNLVMAAVMGERNTEDSRRKSLAVQSGKRRAWERGELSGGPTSDGFERVGDELRLDPDRVDVIRLIGELADQGCGDPSIMRELNRRGHRTKGGGAWTRRRIQDLLTNPIYYGGISWRRGKPDEEINWDTSNPAYWSREDFERRRHGYRQRDLAKGSDRRPKGPPHRNHALAGLAICGRCLERNFATMRPITSTYRRKDGSRRRTYVCRHSVDCTGLCDAPPIDAELVDTHAIAYLQRFLGDFETWHEQFLSGYASQRARLRREVSEAADDLTEQERICERTDRAIGLAETDGDARAAMRAAAGAHQELERRQRRVEAVQDALDGVPDEAPTDAMLDFFNELGAAIRGRLDGANTVARINDALRDIFSSFILEGPPHPEGDEGVFVVPVLNMGAPPVVQSIEVTAPNGDWLWVEPAPIAPPLKGTRLPSPQLANAQE
jgi:DNA invertase Pin-like site-specific DNA recombinase